MNNMNFLTKKYKEKLELEEIMRKNILIFLMVLLVLYVISLGIKQIDGKIQNEIDIENVYIDSNQEKIEELNSNPPQGIELEEKLKLVEEIFSEKDMNISQIFKTLDGIIPSNVWINSLIYNDKTVRIKGISYGKREDKNLEKKIYSFEEKMLASGIYKNVSLNYLKNSIKDGEKINEFEYILILKWKN